MLKTGRSLLLAASGVIVALLLGGGLVVKVGAAEGSHRQAVLFAEVLSQVLDNYVDPVAAEGLLRGAYDGMLASLDPNGAYLPPAEVARWRANSGRAPAAADPGFDVLKSGTSLQVVSVVPGSAADEAGVKVGDHVRSVDGVLVRNLSLIQVRWLIEGAAGSSVRIELMRAAEGFERAELDLARAPRRAASYELTVERGTAVLRLHDLRALSLADLGQELDHARSRGSERLLIDLRNLAGTTPRDAARVAAAFVPDPKLELRDRSRRLVESIETGSAPIIWKGALSVLVNGATAEGAEALAVLLRDRATAKIFGETTFGLGAEPTLFELQNGAGLLLSSALWKTPDGDSWHESGVKPDEEIHGEGRDSASVSADQLKRVLERLEKSSAAGALPSAA